MYPVLVTPVVHPQAGQGYIPHDNIHEINTWSVPFKHSVVI